MKDKVDAENKSEKNNFLQYFIEGEMYLQNPPMTSDEFIRFCKERGIKTSKEELEFFEKEKLLFPIIRIERPVCEEERIKFKKDDGNEYWRPAKYGLQKGETEIERYKVKFYSSYSFSEHDKDLLLNWVREGNLFDPTTKEFQSWDTFLSEELEYEKQKIVSFYSGFQIYWLKILKKSFSITLNLAGDNIKVSSSIVLIDNRQEQGNFSLTEIDDFVTRLKEVVKKEPFEKFFDLRKKKEKLKEDYKKFDKFLKFMLSVQSVYFPYAKSGGRTIQIKGDDKKWQEARRNFRLYDVLKKLNLKIGDVVKWYKNFSDESQKILGIKRDDWVQLWKNIAWSKKDKLEGNIRLGVEYLQWAVMLKRIVEEYLQKEILDIDEISNTSSDDILKFGPEQMKQYGISLRTLRNKKYSDKDKNYYYNRYKRLFYLANDFGLDYQPRVTVFVEGETEETVFPDIFEWYTGKKPENIGVEIICIGGVDNFFGSKQSFKDSKKRKIFVNNFVKLISYNLNKWQIIPFFIGDYEGNVKNALKDRSFVIEWKGEKYSIPEEWQFWWGKSNDNRPFKGINFEMANFSDNEIAKVVSEKLQKQITIQQVREKRIAGKGIEQIDTDVKNHKIEMSKNLYKNLLDKYEKKKDSSVFERPVFKVINRITKLALLNHPPVNREIELKNKKYIENILAARE